MYYCLKMLSKNKCEYCIKKICKKHVPLSESGSPLIIRSSILKTTINIKYGTDREKKSKLPSRSHSI